MERPSRRTFVKQIGLATGSGLLFGAEAGAASRKVDGARFDRAIPVGTAHDVVVCGGGPSGCAAALAPRDAKDSLCC